MKLAPFLKEITLQPLSFLPMVNLKNDGDEYYVFNYENIIKNLKGFKHIIAKHLGIPISPELNNFLAYYVNELQEMEHAGETDVYADITFQEFLDDIKGVHEYSSPEDWVPNPNYDIYSVADLQEITIRPNFAIDPTPVYGVSKIETEIFGVDHLMQLVDLGNYYTIMPYGNQPFVILIPKQYVKNITPLPTHKPLSPKEMDQIKDLVSQGKTEIVKPIQTESAKSFKDLFIESYQQKVKFIIAEYSEKTINTTIERWKKENPQLDDNLAKQLIQRFDQIKSGLTQKLDIVALPDELKQGNNYLNIDKYSYDNMFNLIRSLPENPDKIKKDAVEKFVKNEQIDKPTAQSYVARFWSKKDELKYAVENGLEDAGFTKEEIKEFIPSRLLINNAYLDPRNWKWGSFEQMLDAVFPSQKKVEGETNSVETDADKIYDKDGIEIYKGDNVHKCISYNPVIEKTKQKKYGWCVTQVGNTMYDMYRLGEKSPTFYFVFDRSKDSSPEHPPFKDKWHAFVIQVSENADTYIVTDAENRGDISTKPGTGWDGIAGIVPVDTWAKIKGLKDYFKSIPLSAVERGKKFAQGKNLTANEFKALSQDDKILYIQGKASRSQLTSEILELLPQYKINYEGRSTTLANIAIDNGQKFLYSALKNNEALAKRYAIFRFRHTDYGNEPIPLPFVKYLDEEAKEKYLKTFDGNLTFEYIEKYFGPTATEKYVDEQLKKLGFLPKGAIKYIKNQKLRQLFELYSKLFENWGYTDSTNMSEEQLETLTRMPEQTALITPFTQQQWANLSTQERTNIIELVNKFNRNSTYDALLYGAPFVVKDGGKQYVLVANKPEYPDEFALMDEQGKIIKNNIPSTSELGPITLTNPYPDDSWNKVFDIKDLKVA
jgi:hypothetical protein